MKKILAGLFLIVLLAILLLNAVWYSHGFGGRTIDAAGKPIAGVIVLASWVAKDDSTGHSYFLHAEQGRSNSAGLFVIPAWGPTLFWKPNTRVWNLEPQLWAVHRGYQPSGTWLTDGSSLQPNTMDLTPLRKQSTIIMTAIQQPLLPSYKLVLEDVGRQAWARGNGSPTCIWDRFSSFADLFLLAEQDAGVTAPRFSPDHLCAYSQ